ncbi:hypothetical protein FQR65_LT20149 [Abscondita terminalis]|nr:hypothetical protein FQR65_LT20149 [Abscondita terminalis]
MLRHFVTLAHTHSSTEGIDASPNGALPPGIMASDRGILLAQPRARGHEGDASEGYPGQAPRVRAPSRSRSEVYERGQTPLVHLSSHGNELPPVVLPNPYYVRWHRYDVRARSTPDPTSRLVSAVTWDAVQRLLNTTSQWLKPVRISHTQLPQEDDLLLHMRPGTPVPQSGDQRTRRILRLLRLPPAGRLAPPDARNEPLPIASVERRVEEPTQFDWRLEPRRRQIEQSHQRRARPPKLETEQKNQAELGAAGRRLNFTRRRNACLYYSEGISTRCYQRTKKSVGNWHGSDGERERTSEDVPPLWQRILTPGHPRRCPTARYLAACPDAGKQMNTALLRPHPHRS